MDKKKILLADDEPDILIILKRYLELEGYDVTTASNGKEAIEKIRSNIFDLLMLDVMMPAINGWEVCKKIREDIRTKDVPVIILTARSQNVDALMSFECGADEYVTKPFDYPSMSITIKKLIS